MVYISLFGLSHVRLILQVGHHHELYWRLVCNVAVTITKELFFLRMRGSSKRFELLHIVVFHYFFSIRSDEVLNGSDPYPDYYFFFCLIKQDEHKFRKNTRQLFQHRYLHAFAKFATEKNLKGVKHPTSSGSLQ